MFNFTFFGTFHSCLINQQNKPQFNINKSNYFLFNQKSQFCINKNVERLMKNNIIIKIKHKKILQS